MEKPELRFTYEKDTKNTVRYQDELGEVAHSSMDIAVSKDIAVGSYIQKEALGEPVPQRLRVTIEEEK